MVVDRRPSRLSRVAQASARLGWRLLLFANAIGVVAGVVEAITWVPTAPEETFQGIEGACPGGAAPPCFDVPDIALLPLALVPMVPYVLSLVLFLVLAVPSLLAAASGAMHGRWRPAAREVVTFTAPLLVLIGMETIPHLVLAAPCGPPGLDVCNRFHQLEHVVLGLVPMTLLYRLALLRWSPGVIGVGR